MEATEIQYSFLNESHLDALSAVYNAIFGKTTSTDHFRTKYGLENPERIQYSSVALLNNKIIGFFGFILQEFESYDSTNRLVVLQGCDFFVTKSFRKGKVSKNIFDHSIELAKQHRIPYIYGFQSNQSYNTCRTWGFLDGNHFQRFHVPVVSKYTAGIIRKLGLENLKTSQLERLVRKNPSLKPLQQLNRVKGRFTNNLAFDFFEQKRYFNYYQLELNGCVLYLKYDRILSVGLCHFTEKAEPEKLVQSLKRLARKCLIHEIVFHLQGDSKEVTLLQTYLPAYPSFKISYFTIGPSSVEFSAIQLNYMDMDVF